MGNVEMYYDGDRLRGKKNENGVVTYYLRSSVLGGQVVAELTSVGGWSRGYVYLGGQVLAVQQGGVYWMHQDPVAKSKRVTDASGNVVSTIELDPWGGETNRSSNEAFQPRKFTTYERDSIGSDDAMHRRYNRWWARFEQPDPYDGSYDLTDPQSFNRYSYVQNDPVNFVDPLGLDPQDPLGPPPPPWRPLPPEPPPGEIDRIITNTSAPRSGGGSVLGGDIHFQPEAPNPEGPGGGPTDGTGSQNSQTELISCTFNINITGARGQVLEDAKKELTRIFKSGGILLNVVFNQWERANGGSLNLNVVHVFQGQAADAIVRQGGGSPSNTGILGVTPTTGNNSYVNQAHIANVTRGLKGSGASIGTMIGRVGAHEAIQHRLLGIGPEGLLNDISSSGATAQELRGLATSRFNMHPLTASILIGKCRR
jgi:RHS repeat-associated protein